MYRIMGKEYTQLARNVYDLWLMQNVYIAKLTVSYSHIAMDSPMKNSIGPNREEMLILDGISLVERSIRQF